MLAPVKIPQSYVDWNRANGAPFGRTIASLGWKRRFLTKSAREKYAGPFAIQPNNTTRTFEYPWAFYSADIAEGMTALDIGGGLSGFQFVLDQAGCRVTNVDPGMEADGVGWPCDQASMKLLNERFGTKVELKNTTIDKANLPLASFDRVFSISVIEHLPEHDFSNVIAYVSKLLKPGGLFVLTIDLFLNLVPFTRRVENAFGRNQSIRDIIDSGDWELAQGIPEQLYGMPGFSSQDILSRLEDYLIGVYYPTLVQCLVLRRM